MKKLAKNQLSILILVITLSASKTHCFWSPNIFGGDTNKTSTNTTNFKNDSTPIHTYFNKSNSRLVSQSSLFIGNMNRVKYCVISSKISYSCIFPNIRFFIYTQLISYPYIGPALSIANIAYLTLNYLPYIIRDLVCFVKAVILGGIIDRIPLPFLTSFSKFKVPFLMEFNQTLGNGLNETNLVMLNQLLSNLDNQTVFSIP